MTTPGSASQHPISLLPEWVDAVASCRTAVPLTVSGDRATRQHVAAVLRVAADQLVNGEGPPEGPDQVAGWLRLLATQAAEQVHLWVAAAERLQAEAAEIAREHEILGLPAVARGRLLDKAHDITDGTRPA
jgi:hypothetical protein